MESLKIKDLPLSERPRERLMNYGAFSLSNEELLSIILKVGTRNMSVKNLSLKLLSYVDGIQNLENITLAELLKIKGIGTSKACEILALCELSKRMNRKVDSLKSIKFTSPELVYEFYKNRVSLMQEGFYAIYLDGSNKIISEKLLFVGTVNRSLVHPRDIFKEAYLLNASSVICMHNHPSGEVYPSEEDERLTERLKYVGNVLGIDVLDHIIIGDGYYSFLENNKM